MLRMNFAKSLRLLLALALVILCALLAWGLVLFVLGLGIQWWAKAMILICLAATVVIIILLRKMWLKRREMRFVDGIIGSDMPGNISAIDDASRELRRRFKEAVTTLRKSHLKGRGNPLYVLPWYLLVGKSGSGKSTAVKSARLPSPFGDVNRISGVEGTRNCDWWFFDDSVVIDTAGRYALHRNETLDKSEWQAFLSHLVKYRRREPINGIIVTVEADQLLAGDPEKVEDEGRIMRRRIDEVINVMGAKFPIYLLVTKCDLIFGMNRFGQLLSEPALDQAMGMMNHEGLTDVGLLVDKTIDILVDKLKDYRLLLSNQEEVRGRHYLEPAVLLFPDEMARLRAGLTTFCKGAFKDNPFQELPPLRGIYFCSGQQSGRPVPSRADAACHLGSQEPPNTGRGLFLHDFFARILPADRSLYSPTRRARDWKRLTGNLWLTAFVTAVLILCILLTHAWNENKRAINSVSPEYKQVILFKNEPLADTAIIADFGRQIKKIEQINADWNGPRMGLNASIHLERELKSRYCRRFHEHFDADINNRIEGVIANGGWYKDNADPAVRYIPFITRRINLIKARFEGADSARLAELPDPDYALMLFGKERDATIDEVLGNYKDAYIDYLVWQTETEPLNRSMAGMQRLLNNHFRESDGDMRWLVTWADRHLHGKEITLNSFWRAGRPDSGMAAISPAFTREGQRLINRFVTEELESAVDQTLYIAQPKVKFAEWYQDAFYGAWLDYCGRFNQGLDLFVGEAEQAEILERLTTEKTPYTALIERMEQELFAVLDQEEPWPSLKPDSLSEAKYGHWLSRVRGFGIVRHAASGENLGDQPAAAGIAQRVAGKVSPRTAFAAKIALGTLEENRLLKAGQAYQQYRKAISGFAGVTRDRKYAYKLVRECFEDNPAEAKSSLQTANRALAELNDVLATGQSLEADGTDPFGNLFKTPLDRLWQYSVAQSGCHLQDLWDTEVIVKVQGIHAQRQRAAMLFGEQGLARKFIQTHVDPFVGRSSARGYYPLKLHHTWVPFYKNFFDYVQQGERWWVLSGNAVQESYSVTVAAYPTDVNVEARMKPFMTRLMLETGEGHTILENKQYPVEKIFTWMPVNDGNVILQILFENFTINVVYAGYGAFGQFLADFANGTRRFKAGEFPEHRDELSRIGVEEIDVTYRIPENQARPIRKLLYAAPGKPPATIVRCEQPGT